MSGPRVVALGGGHGLSASLSALRLVTDQITAVVTVADNGGSSGRLRDEYDVLPPGDLRMALAALCDDSEWGHTWRDVLQHRFAGDGELGGHAVGNLLIVALWELHHDPVKGLDLVGRLLNARGRVLPMADVPLEIRATVRGGRSADGLRVAPDELHEVVGQVAVATTQGRVDTLRVVPHDPPACPESLRAVAEADWVVLGPGSWFTSVMPHLLVPDLRRALVATSGRKMLTLNVDVAGETAGFSAADHVDTLRHHAPELSLDVVLADPRVVDDLPALRRSAAQMGATVVVSEVARAGRQGHHDVLRLAAAYRDVFG